MDSFLVRHTLWLLLFFAAMSALAKWGTRADDANRGERHAIIDVLHYFLNPYLAGVLLLGLPWVQQHFPDFHAVNRAWLEARLPTWALLALAVLLADVVGYFRHRLTHTRVLWPIHAVHHGARHLHWLSFARFHPLNTALNNALPILLLHPLGLPAQLLVEAALVRTLFNVVNHGNVRINLGPLNHVFATPEFHRWHHVTDLRVANRNFAVVFACIDHLFGTFHLPAGEKPQAFGVAEAVPERYSGQLLWPLRCWLNMLLGRDTPLLADQPPPRRARTLAEAVLTTDTHREPPP